MVELVEPVDQLLPLLGTYAQGQARKSLWISNCLNPAMYLIEFRLVEPVNQTGNCGAARIHQRGRKLVEPVDQNLFASATIREMPGRARKPVDPSPAIRAGHSGWSEVRLVEPVDQTKPAASALVVQARRACGSLPAPGSPDICGQARRQRIKTFKLLALVQEPSGQARKSGSFDSFYLYLNYGPGS